jgi:endoglucanase
VLWAGLARAADDDVRLSSIGYLPDRAKVATVAGGGTTFSLRRTQDGVSALSGDLGAAHSEAGTGESLRSADFSSVTEPGTYYLEVPEVGRSVDFRIGADVFREQLVTVMLGFYGWRAGTVVEFTFQGQTFRQGPGHLQDGLLDYLGQVGVRRDGSRGWYDAGDYGKYTVNSGFTLGMMLQAWESFRPGLEGLALQIPETDNSLPDYLDELKWQYDWLETMQYSSTDGRVSHKLTSRQFAGFVMPEEDVAPTYFSPYGSAATADWVAAMAKGSRAFRPYDAALADRMLAAARVSYQWLQENTAFVPAGISAFTTGGYQNSTRTADRGERLWAAAEMWEATGDAAALQDFEQRANAFTPKVDPEFDWGSPKNLGMFTYVLSAREGKDSTLETTVRNAIVQVADTLVANRNGSGYGRAITSYYWGINGVVARTCMTLQVAHQLAPNDAYLDACSDQVAHLYGRNYYGRSYVTGAGKNPPMHPHHRPSGADGVVPPFPGLLVGGPGGLNNNALDYQDLEELYQVNEVAINWNGALVYALAGFLPPAGTGGTGAGGSAGGSGGTASTGGSSAADPSVNTVPSGGGEAATTAPSSTSDAGSEGGCGCRTAKGHASSAAWWALLLAWRLARRAGRPRRA